MDFIYDYGEVALFVLAALGLLIVGLLYVMYRSRVQLHREKLYYKTPLRVKDVVEGHKARQRRQVPLAPQQLEDEGLIVYLKRVLYAPTTCCAFKDQPEPPFTLGQEICEAIDNCSHLKQANEIARHVDNLDSNLVELVEAVAADPLLSVSVLKASNAARFGRQTRVSSLRAAIEILGQHELRYVIYREYMAREYKGLTLVDSNLLDDLWHHSILTGVTAGALAHHFPALDRSLLYTSALLHDIGKFILMRTAVVEQSKDYCCLPYIGPYFEDNRRLWNVDHARLGSEAAKRWGLDSSIGELIAGHHRLEHHDPASLGLDSTRTQQLLVLHLANQLAKYFSREPRLANYPAPLHFSCGRLLDERKILNILMSREFVEELERVTEMRS